jgi:hypothetical protein
MVAFSVSQVRTMVSSPLKEITGGYNNASSHTDQPTGMLLAPRAPQSIPLALTNVPVDDTPDNQLDLQLVALKDVVARHITVFNAEQLMNMFP